MWHGARSLKKGAEKSFYVFSLTDSVIEESVNLFKAYMSKSMWVRLAGDSKPTIGVKVRVCGFLLLYNRLAACPGCTLIKLLLILQVHAEQGTPMINLKRFSSIYHLAFPKQ